MIFTFSSLLKKVHQFIFQQLGILKHLGGAFFKMAEDLNSWTGYIMSVQYSKTPRPLPPWWWCKTASHSCTNTLTWMAKENTQTAGVTPRQQQKYFSVITLSKHGPEGMIITPVHWPRAQQCCHTTNMWEILTWFAPAPHRNQGQTTCERKCYSSLYVTLYLLLV